MAGPGPRWRRADPVATHRCLWRRAREAEGAGTGLRLLLHSGRNRPVIDRPARRCRQPLPRHLPAAARRSGAPGDHASLLAARSAAALNRAGLPSWAEEGGIRFESKHGDFGDAILARKDAPSSYHLACVVDDAASGVTLVVRGEDLRPSTLTQRLLQTLLGLHEPAYLHHPLVTHEDGRRLAKRDRAPTLEAMRDKASTGMRSPATCSKDGCP